MKATIKYCPRCKSPNINVDAGILTGSYYCGKCGYQGPIVLEQEK